MAIILKTNPSSDILTDGRASFSEALFKDAEVDVGDEVFIWTNETAGGQGLVGVAIVEDTKENSTITLRISSVSESGGVLNNNNLKQYRDDNSDKPISTISKKIYRHAHSKTASLTDEEARFARHLFSMR